LSAVGIIGGTGLEELPPQFACKTRTVETPFGEARVTAAAHGAEEFLFLSRHGAAHGLAPHQINYQANIAALAALGVGPLRSDPARRAHSGGRAAGSSA
jgi:purine nucleoside phosphorylase